MFWNFTHMLHGLAEDHEVAAKQGMGWTDEEIEKLNIINAQLSYNRLGDDLPEGISIYDDGEKYESCLEVVPVIQDGTLVWGLPEGYKKFFEEHLGVGKYIGSASTDPCMGEFMCPHCFDVHAEQVIGRKWSELEAEIKELHVKAWGDDTPEEERDEWKEKLNTLRDQKDAYVEAIFEGQDPYSEEGEEWVLPDDQKVVHDYEGVGVRFYVSDPELAIKEVVSCPKCGKEGRAVMYDEGPDIDSVHVFEEGSFTFSHYGRGAGISFRFHKNVPGLTAPDVPELVLAQFVAMMEESE